MDIIEAIKERRSVRSFNGEGITDSQREELLTAIENSYSPFGGKLTIRMKQFDLKEGYKPSTYGMIKGAVDFFLLGMGADDESALTAGFRFEQVILKAWQMGLGTCWIAATFKGSDFERGEAWPEGESLKIVSPVGVSGKPSLMEKMTRLMAGSKNRKPFDELFFYQSFNQSVPSDNKFYEALEMLRLAPSSTNSQPWRALVEGDRVHFFCKPKSKLSLIDCGIGLCHFYETEKFRGREGSFVREKNYPIPQQDWRYIMSYQS